MAVAFPTHNAYHAHSVSDEFLILRRRETLATFSKADKSIGEVIELMAGGAELRSLLSAAEVNAIQLGSCRKDLTFRQSRHLSG